MIKKNACTLNQRKTKKIEYLMQETAHVSMVTVLLMLSCIPSPNDLPTNPFLLSCSSRVDESCMLSCFKGRDTIACASMRRQHQLWSEPDRGETSGKRWNASEPSVDHCCSFTAVLVKSKAGVELRAQPKVSKSLKPTDLPEGVWLWLHLWLCPTGDALVPNEHKVTPQVGFKAIPT